MGCANVWFFKPSHAIAGNIERPGFSLPIEQLSLYTNC